MVIFCILVLCAVAATGQTWDGGGPTNNWSDPLNWSTDAVPNTGANVTFNTTSTKDCVIDVNITTGTFLIDTGYTGTISQGSSTIQHNAGFTQRDGTFSGGSAAHRFNGSRTFTAGNFTATSGTTIFRVSGTAGSTTLTVDAEWVFDPNSGTIEIEGPGSGGSSVNVSGTATELIVHNLVINSDANTVGLSMGTSGSRVWNIAGTLHLINGVINGNADRRIRTENAVLIDAAFDGGSTFLELVGNLERVITIPAGADMPNLIVNAPNTTINTSGTGSSGLRSLDLQGVALMTNGSVDQTFSGTMTIASNFTQGSGSLTFNGSFTQTGGLFTGGTGTIDMNVSRTFSGGTFVSTSGELIFTTSGTPGSQTLVINEGWAFDPNGGTLTFDEVGSNPAVSVSGTATNLNVNNLRIAALTATGGLSMGGTDTRIWTVGGQLHLVNGVINGAVSRFLRAEGNVLIEAGYDGGNVPITYAGSAEQNFENLGGNHPTGAVTIDKSGGTLNLLSDMNLSNGTAGFALTNGTISTGDFAVLSGTRAITRTNGYIIGDLDRRINSIGVREYPVGTGNGFSPVTANITVLGTNPTQLRIGAKQGSHPRLDATSALGRYWPITETGNVTATLTFNYFDTDVHGNETDYRLHRVATSELQIFQPPQATIDTTANTATVTGVTEFSDWTLAEVGQPVSISPSGGTFVPGSVINFSAVAGYPPYTFSIIQNNSGASFDSQTATYTAGNTIGAQDVIRVADSFGFFSDATITVDIIPTRLVITQQPVSTTAGLTLNTITAELQDDAGNRAATAANSVTIAFADNPGGATLLGTTTRNAVAGIATFNDISIQRAAEGYTLAVSSTGLTGATSNAFNVAPGDPNQLVFTVQPSDTDVSADIEPAPQVVVRDQFGNTVDTVDLDLTISIASNPGSATLSGTLTRQSDGGVATFNGLSLDRAGTGYTLAVNGSGLEVESDPFNISAPILLVTTTDPTGPGSLSEQINIANQRPGPDVINFAIPGNGPFTIPVAFTGQIPMVTDPVSIDATSQPGYSGIPLVELDGPSDPGSVTLFIDADNAEIRGFLINTRGTAVFIGSGRSGITIKQNRIGLDHGGELSQITPFVGIQALNTSNLIIGASGEGNIIAASVGISLNAISNSISVKGNLIGTNAAGTIGLGGDAQVGLSAPGINLQSQLFNSQIGGTGPGEGNLFSGHRVGLSITGDNNVIEGNKFGTDHSGTSPIQYRSPSSPKNAILLFGNHNAIGGNSPESGNTFAFLDLPVRVAGLVNGRTASEGNLIRHNSSHSSGRGLPEFIFLQPGSYNNDPLDADEGPNWLQNHPVLTSAVLTGTGTRIVGTFSSEPSENYVIDFFLSDVCSIGFGDAKEFLGSVEVTTDAGGLAALSHELPLVVPVGKSITSLATDSENNTSQLSGCRLVAQNTATISGTISDSSGPLSNVSVALTGGRSLTTVTDSQGNYSFTDLPTDVNYLVSPARATYEFTPPSRSFVNLLSDQPNSNFTAQKTSFRITGTVGRLGGVTMTLAGTANRTAEAHPAGTFRFDELAAGNYTLAPSKPGYTFTPASVNVALTTEDASAEFSAASILSQLTGRFYFTEPSGASTVNLKSVQADGRGLVTLFTNQPLLFPAASPDGRTIFMSGAISGLQGIYSANFDGTNLVRRTSPPANQSDGFPGVSADGARVAFIRTNTTGDSREIRAMAPDGSDQTLISQTEIPLRFTSWNANGLAIASVAADRLRIISTAGSIGTFGPIFGMPRWSPDGTRILSRSGGLVGNGSDLFTFDTVNGDSIFLGLSDFFVVPFGYGWSPDGQFVNYTRFNNSNSSHELVVTPSNSVNKLVVFSQSQQSSFKGIDWAPTPNANVPQSFGAAQSFTLGGVTVTFADVQTEGELTVDPIAPNSLGFAPDGYAFTNVGYDIQTTATFTPPVGVCIEVPENVATTEARFNRLAILHNENGSLVDRTTTRELATRTVCAETNGLSEFVVAEQIDPSLASITGLVVDSNGEPMVNVSVRMTGAEERYVETDAEGLFTFPNLENGANYEVQAREFGYIFDEFSKIFISVSGEETVVFTGTESSRTISGRVVDGVGFGRAGVNVSLSGDKIANTVTNTDGIFVFEELPADGSYTVTPTDVLGSVTPEEIIVSPLLTDTLGLEFELLGPTAASVSISGRVIDPDGRGVARAAIGLTTPDGNTRSVMSNGFGYFSLDGIAAGSNVVLTVRHRRLRFEPRVLHVSTDVDDLVILGSW